MSVFEAADLATTKVHAIRPDGTKILASSGPSEEIDERTVETGIECARCVAEIDRFLASKGLRGRTIKYGIYDAIEEVWETADRSVEVRLRAYHQGDLYMYVELWDKDYVDDEVDPETSMSFGPSDAEAVISWLSRTLRMIR